MAPLIVVLLVSTMVAIVLSVVTYTMLSESMHGETSSVTAIENFNTNPDQRNTKGNTSGFNSA